MQDPIRSFRLRDQAFGRFANLGVEKQSKERALASFRENDFWRHHAGVFAIAFLILSLSRSVGVLNDLASMRQMVMQSLVMVLVALPLQTGGALLGLHYLRA